MVEYNNIGFVRSLIRSLAPGPRKDREIENFDLESDPIDLASVRDMILKLVFETPVLPPTNSKTICKRLVPFHHAYVDNGFVFRMDYISELMTILGIPHGKLLARIVTAKERYEIIATHPNSLNTKAILPNNNFLAIVVYARADLFSEGQFLVLDGLFFRDFVPLSEYLGRVGLLVDEYMELDEFFMQGEAALGPDYELNPFYKRSLFTIFPPAFLRPTKGIETIRWNNGYIDARDVDFPDYGRYSNLAPTAKLLGLLREQQNISNWEEQAIVTAFGLTPHESNVFLEDYGDELIAVGQMFPRIFEDLEAIFKINKYNYES